MNNFLKEQHKKCFKITKNGYIFDRVIFNAAMFIVFAYLLFVAYSADFKLDYFKCNFDETGRTVSFESCKNPFYTPSTWKNEEKLPPGLYGKEPGALFNWAAPFAFLMIILAFVFNHYFYNRHRKIEFKKTSEIIEDMEKTGLFKNDKK